MNIDKPFAHRAPATASDLTPPADSAAPVTPGPAHPRSSVRPAPGALTRMSRTLVSATLLSRSLLSTGLLSTGLLSMGLLSMGLLSSGLLTMGLTGCITAAPPVETDPTAGAGPASGAESAGNTAGSTTASGPAGTNAGASRPHPSEFVDDSPTAPAPPASAAGTRTTSTSNAPSSSAASAPVPDSPIPSFGAGAELERKEGAPTAASPASSATPPATGAPVESAAGTNNGVATASNADTATADGSDSFGQGAELYRAAPGEELPPPARLRGRLGPAGPVAQGSPVPPIPPPVRSDALTLMVYQLQTEVYGLQWASANRPLLPRMVLRIDALAAPAQELVGMTRGDKVHESQANSVQDAVVRLQNAAHLRDRVEVDAQLWRLQELLLRMRQS